jgi:signal transduction histidine kinase
VSIIPRTLRFQLLLVLTLAIAPLAALAVYLALDDGRRDSAEAQAAARRTVQLVSQDLNRLIQGSRDLVLGFSRNPAIQDHPETCGATLAALRPSFPQFASLSIIGLDRGIVCSSIPTNARTIPAFPGDGRLAERVQKTRDFAVGDFRVSSITRRPVLPLVGPVFDQKDQIRNFFVATFDVTWLSKEVSQVPMQKEAILLVLDRNGRVIARNPHADEWIGVPAPPYEQALPGRDDFTSEVKGEGGVWRVYSMARVPAGDGLVVVMKIPSDDIYMPSRRRLLMHLIGLATVGLLVLGVTWVGTGRVFGRPLSMLIEAANRLGAGDLSARSGVAYTREIGGFAQSFDQMADALQRERAKTLKASQAFRSIIEGTSTTTGEEFFRSLARSLASALGSSIAIVGELTKDPDTVRTIAICADGELIENFEYGFRDTPCEGVINQNLSCYPSKLQQLFPRDTKLHKLGMESYLGAPLVDSKGAALGLIAVLHRGPMEDDLADAESILKIFATRAGVELERLRAERALRESMAENEEMVRRLRALTARIESVREEERIHIAREIHDELGQQLTAMRFDLADLMSRIRQAHSRSEPLAPLLERFTGLTGLVDSTIRDVRRIATELRPSVLDTFGPIAAIEWLVEDFQKRTRIRCVYEGIEDLSASRELSTALFRICQEALTNVARHAGATEVRIRVTADGEWLSLEVSDNGRGVSEETLARTSSLGVLGMRERARIAGGEFEIASSSAHGVTVLARLPLAPAAEGATV